MALLLITLGMSAYSQEFFDKPIVPVEVVQKGRQAVVSYLSGQVDYVKITYDGKSLSKKQERYIYRDELRRLGYVNNGSFKQLELAVSNVLFDSEVIETPNGYDLSATIDFKSGDGHTVMSSYGTADVQVVKGGDLSANLYLNSWIPNDLLLKFADNVTGAKWVSESWRRGSMELDLFYDDESSYIDLPTWALDEGTVLVGTDDKDGFSSHLSGYPLNFGGSYTIKGEELRVWLGMGSTEIQVFTDELDISPIMGAYKDGDQYYGRPPLTELVLTKPTRGTLFASIGVWGSDKKFLPSRVVVEVVNEVSAPTPVGQKPAPPLKSEFELKPSIIGGWVLDLPAGIYHLRVTYPDVADWNTNPNPKG